jgi:hypothetical protein
MAYILAPTVFDLKRLAVTPGRWCRDRQVFSGQKPHQVFETQTRSNSCPFFVCLRNKRVLLK